MNKLLKGLALLAFLLVGHGTALAQAAAPAAVRAFYQAFMSGDAARFEAVAATGFTDRVHATRPADGGMAGVTGAIQGFKAGIPDLKIEIEHLWRDGRAVIAKTVITGTHTAPLFGTAATGKRIRISAIGAFEIVDGKILNLWHVEEMSKLFEQLRQP